MKNDKLIRRLRESLIAHVRETGTFISDIEVNWEGLWNRTPPNQVMGQINLTIPKPEDLKKEQEQEQQEQKEKTFSEIIQEMYSLIERAAKEYQKNK